MLGGAKHAPTGLNRNAQFTAGVRFVVALILVVDDEPSIRSVACQVLEDVGYSTVAAASANEAREVLSLTHPDLMILDLRLPDASGLELALQIQPSYRDYRYCSSRDIPMTFRVRESPNGPSATDSCQSRTRFHAS
jgi:CheY-like chemotaxis protein